jgi:hypothetical protein
VTQGPNFSSQVEWPFFLKFVENDKTFVLFQTNRFVFFIPKRQLSPEQISCLREAFARHIANTG